MAAFSVTSCTASRAAITPEDTIDITMTVKNTFGSNLSTFGLCLCFTGEDRGASGLWLPTVQAESAISWANGASKSFTWSIVPDAIMSQPQYASIYASLRSRLSAVRTLPFRLQLVGTSANGSYASMTYTLSEIQYIDKYYNPQITIRSAITRANASIGEADRISAEEIQQITGQVTDYCSHLDRPPDVEEVQDQVERQLMARGHFELCRHYTVQNVFIVLTLSESSHCQKVIPQASVKSHFFFRIRFQKRKPE